MRMKLRTVIYSGKVEIDNVPVYTCKMCSRSEVYPVVKTDLTGLIGKLGSRPKKQIFKFNEWNEWAHILVESCIGTNQQLPDPAVVEKLKADRIDMLLDLYSLADKLGDMEWKDELSKRLVQLSHSLSIHKTAVVS